MVMWQGLYEEVNPAIVSSVHEVMEEDNEGDSIVEDEELDDNGGDDGVEDDENTE